MHNIYPYAIIICKKNLKMETYTRQNNVKKHDNNDKPYRCSYLMHNGGWTYIWKRWMRSHVLIGSNIAYALNPKWKKKKIMHV